jgi:hypothetical protein
VTNSTAQHFGVIASKVKPAGVEKIFNDIANFFIGFVWHRVVISYILGCLNFAIFIFKKFNS